MAVKWINKFLLNPVPMAAGCVADTVNIVCLSNGPFSEDKGYISIDSQNGTIRWRDKILTYPTMPLLDNYGDVTGTDGTNLVHYDQDGKKYPIISVAGTAPVFHMQLVGNLYLLMVSENGGLFVRDTMAIPVASMFLNDIVQGTKGLFIPVSQPVVNGQRFYLLTEFVPTNDTLTKNELTLQRLYAIDIHHRMDDIITIAWFFDFEKKESQDLPAHGVRRCTHHNFLNIIKDDIRSKQNLLWDQSSGTVYVSLPPLYKHERKDTQQANTFWALKDHGNYTSLNFRSDFDVTHMATFESDGNSGMASPQQLWVITSSSKILSINEKGTVIVELDLAILLNAQVNVTSKMSLVRNETTSSDILIFGVKTMPDTDRSKDTSLRFLLETRTNTNYIVAIDSDNGTLLWKVPVPYGLEVKGQIAGSKRQQAGYKDQLVFYADDNAKTGHIFTLH